MAACLLSALVVNAGCSSGGSSSPPATPTVGLSASAFSVAEDGNSVDISVNRTGSSAGAVSVDYATSDGTATTAGSDYTAVSGTLNWADGDSASKTITVSITDDNQYEGDETVAIALSNVSGGTLGTASATLTINEEDVPGTLAFAATAVTVTESDAAGVQATLTVSRTGGSDGDVTVNYDTANGTADSGDYTAISSGTLNWSHGDTADKTITVDIAGDTTTELSESFSVSLSNPGFITLGTDTTATVNITDNDSVTITGTISAPSGTVAFNGPSLTDRMFAALLGSSAHAAIGDFASAVGAGVTVNVYEVDANGEPLPLGSPVPITTATTDSSGAYVLAAPLDAPASKYIIRAEGSTGTLESRITAATVDVDPVTDATSLLVVYAASDLADINVNEITTIQEEVSDLVEEIDAASLTTATALSAGLEAAAKADEEINNVVTSTAAAGTICGTVTKGTGTTPLENILVVVKDFGNWVTRAKTKTAVDGTYCLNVPFGNYIVVAINRTGDGLDADRSASEWYNASGGGVFPVNGDMVSVPDANQVDVNFDLDPGIRIHGTVTASGGLLDGQFMEGVQVQIRDVDTNFPVASARVKADGTYRVNVMPGRYTVQVRNTTQKPYATQYATTTANAANDHNLSFARIYDSTGLTPGSSGQTVDFVLSPGYLLSGTITESSSPVTGTLILVDDPTLGGANARLRTNIDGQFRIWLKPAIYNVLAYGQTDLGIDMTAGDYTVTSFTADVAKQPIVVRDSGANPVSQAKVLLYDSTGQYLGRQVTSSDGSTTLYSAATAGDHKIEVRIDDPQNHSSIIYNGLTRIADATAVPLDPAVVTPLSSFNVDLMDAGVLKVVVTSDGSTPAPGIPVQVRDGGNDGTNKFVGNRTHSDGITYLSLPGGVDTGSPWIYENVRINGSVVGASGNCLNVGIVQGMTTTVTFNTSNPTGCSVGSPQ